MFEEANTDEGIADMLHGIFGFELSPNAIRNRRDAVSTHMQTRHACPDNAHDSAPAAHTDRRGKVQTR